MHIVKKHFLIAAVVFLAPQLAISDSLVDIYESALENDPVLRAARASFNADREIKNISRAALLPQLAISGEYKESETNDSSPLFGDGGTIDSDGTSYGASLTQAIFDMPSRGHIKNSLSKRCAVRGAVAIYCAAIAK